MNPSDSVLKVKLLKFINRTRKFNDPKMTCSNCKKIIKKHSDEELLKCFMLIFWNTQSIDEIQKIIETN